MLNNVEELLKSGDLYSIEIAGQVFVWKKMAWKEFRKLRDLAISMPFLVPEMEEYIYSTYVIDCTDEITPLEELPAGIVSTVAKVILNFSGALKPDLFLDLLENQRANLSSLEEQVVLAICKYFGYKPEELDNLDWETIVKRLAQAELIATNKLPEMPIKFEKHNKKRDLLNDIMEDSKAMRNA